MRRRKPDDHSAGIPHLGTCGEHAASAFPNAPRTPAPHTKQWLRPAAAWWDHRHRPPPRDGHAALVVDGPLPTPEMNPCRHAGSTIREPPAEPSPSSDCPIRAESPSVSGSGATHRGAVAATAWVDPIPGDCLAVGAELAPVIRRAALAARPNGQSVPTQLVDVVEGIAV